MATLAQRLALLKANSNPNSKSDSIEDTPLATFLILYNKANLYHSDYYISDECYINYMEGAKALYAWLSPIVVPIISEDLLPKKVHSCYHAYEIQHLAMIISGKLKSGVYDMVRVKYIEKVICYLIAQEILK